MAMLLRLPSVLALTVAAKEALRFVFSIYLRRRKRIRGAKQYDGLESLVSFSACLIAANRALETERPDAYIVDPLAAGLCGEQALASRRGMNRLDAPAMSHAGTSGQQQQQQQLEEQAPGSQRVLPPRRPIPRIIMRTKFFDDVVSLVTWRGHGSCSSGDGFCQFAGYGADTAAAGVGCHARLLAACHGADPCLQVVLLGSGLDARPWRLPLPPGLRWFEVDRRDVLEAKRVRLGALGAQTEQVGPLGATSCARTAEGMDQKALKPAVEHSAVPGALGAPVEFEEAQAEEGERDAGEEAGSQKQEQDLESRQGQSNGLEAGEQQSNGHAPELGQPQVHEAAAAAPSPGSSVNHPLCAASWVCCPADLARRGWSRALVASGLDPSRPVLWVLEGLLYYLEEGDVRAVLREAASVSAPGSVLAASVIYAPPAAAAVAATAAGHSEREGGMASAGPNTQQRAQAGRDGTGYRLYDEFKWRCQEEVPQFFGSCGWSTQAALSWVAAAGAYGLPVVEHASGVYFVTATVAGA